jgi:thiol-disulfide isomerase/thioredoxin
LPWVNVAPLRMDKQLGRPVLVEFWDFCRPNSLRTLPYVRAWHERYQAQGLRVVGVHSPGFEPSRDEQSVREAVSRLEIAHPVLIDSQLDVWRLYENAGWPARYLFDGRGMLTHYHYGEGAYAETERAIQELLGVSREPVAPQRPEDVEGAPLVAPSPDHEGPWSGDYEAGGVWAVLSGRGEIVVNATARSVSQPGAVALIEHERHTAASLDLQVGPGVVCHAICFTPGLAPEA